MPPEIVECEEFGVIGVGLEQLLIDGELAIDPRIADKGFLSISLVKGQVIFRADRHVGLIPVNRKLAVRVKPRAQISNLSRMIVRSGVPPNAIPGFSRGYLPRLESDLDAERTYLRSFITAVDLVVRRGLFKAYVMEPDPPPWRGRLLPSSTIARHRARNVRYKNEFEYRTLSLNTPENMALKFVLRALENWLLADAPRSADLIELRRLAAHFSHVTDYTGDVGRLTRQVGLSASRLPPAYSYYQDALWTAFLFLQRTLPDVSREGFITMDSLIVDVSKVFEAFIRRTLAEGLKPLGWRVVDGNGQFYPFFADANTFRVKPDIVIVADGAPIAVLDVKYKPDVKEADRYEVLSFLEALGVRRGGFICPAREGAVSHRMGQTIAGSELSLLRFDTASSSFDAEIARFLANVRMLAASTFDYQ